MFEGFSAISNLKKKENDSLSEHFSFTVKSVICRFTVDVEFDNDSGC